MKRAALGVILSFFVFSALIMPYANYDDVRSICAVYNHCLQQDADMDFFEFIGEKMLVLGLDPNEQREKPSHNKHQPVNAPAIVQIHSGAICQPASYPFITQPLTAPATVIPVRNVMVVQQEYNPAIFHPPVV